MKIIKYTTNSIHWVHTSCPPPPPLSWTNISGPHNVSDQWNTKVIWSSTIPSLNIYIAILSRITPYVQHFKNFSPFSNILKNHFPLSNNLKNHSLSPNFSRLTSISPKFSRTTPITWDLSLFDWTNTSHCCC